jgi:hypothetical protein
LRAISTKIGEKRRRYPKKQRKKPIMNVFPSTATSPFRRGKLMVLDIEAYGKTLSLNVCKMKIFQLLYEITREGPEFYGI